MSIIQDGSTWIWANLAWANFTEYLGKKWRRILVLMYVNDCNQLNIHLSFVEPWCLVQMPYSLWYLWHSVVRKKQELQRNTSPINKRHGLSLSVFLEVVSLSLSLASRTCSNLISLSLSRLKRDLKWPAHVPTGGLRLIHVGAAAELCISCWGRWKGEQSKLMAQTSLHFHSFEMVVWCQDSPGGLTKPRQ